VQIDLADQSALEELSADRGREDLEVLAIGGPNPIRTASGAAIASWPIGSFRVSSASRM
jgi:hypothetical protein